MANENDGGEDGGEGLDPAVETRARQLGWAPKEKFRGDPEMWVDAATYVKRGEEILPIVKENNRRLQADVARLAQHAGHMEQLVRAGQESMQALLEHQEETTRKTVEREKRALLARLKDVRENGTIEEEFEIQDELTTINASLAAPVKKEEKPAQQQQQRIDPAFLAWQEENGDWFGVDKRKTALAVGIGEELRSDPANAGLMGKAFYDRISQELGDMTPARRRPVDKVAGGGNHTPGGGGGGGTAKKTYASLPPEAKEVCDRQEKKLVGEGRAFKDQAGWRKHYAEQYFKGE
jgi:hypothetical protein